MVQLAGSPLDDDPAPAARWELAPAVLACSFAGAATHPAERCRLGRDLYDRVGPALGAVSMLIGTVRSQLQSDPVTATATLVRLRADLQVAVADVRRLVWALGTPSEQDRTETALLSQPPATPR
jgi:signal transduction histidine kinase